jgi:hypothetical protein
VATGGKLSSSKLSSSKGCRESMSAHGRPRRARSAPLKMREAVSAGDVDAFLGPDDNNDSDSSDGEGILVESPAAAEARALAAADLAAIREAYAREKEDAGSERAPSQTRKKSEQKGCGGTRPEALNKLLEPLGDGTGRFGLACCVARGVIKFGSLRCMTEEKLGDYVKRGKAVYEDLGPKSKQHVDFIERLAAEMKVKNLTRYFYSSGCHSHLGNVWSLLSRVEKKVSTAAPGAAQTVPGRAGGAEMAGGDTKRQKVEPPSAMDEDDDSTSDGIVAQEVYARSPFHRGEEVRVPANAFGDDYAAENPETLSGTLICIKSVERDEAGEERRIWDVQYETGPFETDESFFDTDETRRVSSDEDDPPADLSDEAPAPDKDSPPPPPPPPATPPRHALKKRQRRDTTEREPGSNARRIYFFTTTTTGSTDRNLGEDLAQVAEGGLVRHEPRADLAHDRPHGEAAVLDLLQGQLLRDLELERVQAEVARRPLSRRAPHRRRHAGDELDGRDEDDARADRVRVLLPRVPEDVHLASPISLGPARERAEGLDPDDARGGQHGHPTVLELGLAQPVQINAEVVDLGQAQRVEAHVAGHAPIEILRLLEERHAQAVRVRRDGLCDARGERGSCVCGCLSCVCVPAGAAAARRVCAPRVRVHRRGGGGGAQPPEGFRRAGGGAQPPEGFRRAGSAPTSENSCRPRELLAALRASASAPDR